MPTELQELQQFYKNYNIYLSTEWLESCIEWCKDGNLPRDYSITDMQRMVYEQWLILDLRDAEVPALPKNLSNKKNDCLTGSYCLQMMQIVDISKPKLWQLQRIRNNVNKNTETEKDFGTRVLQLTLTDGVQEVEAMEFQPVPCLNINLLPGTKIRITGPLMVRNGRLMLKKDNVKYLGGAVDEMRVKFAAENVLARALKLPENPNPYIINENVLDVSEANTTTQINRSENSHNYNAVHLRNTTVINQNTRQNKQNALSSNQKISNTQKTATNREEIPPEFQVDDDLLRELEADFEETSVWNIKKPKANARISNASSNLSTLKATPAYSQPNDNGRSRDCSSPDLFEEMEVDDELLNEHLNHIDVDEMTSNARTVCSGNMTTMLDSATCVNDVGKLNIEKNLKVVQDLEVSSSVLAKTKPVSNDEVVILDDSFDDIDIDLHLDNIDQEMANLPSSTQIRNDLKNRIKSPELKSRNIDCKNSKLVFNFGSTSSGSDKCASRSKKLTQGTLNFGSSSKKPGLNLPPYLNSNAPEVEDDNPFSIFKNLPLKATKSSLRGFCSSPEPSSNRPQEPSFVCNSSPEFKSKFLPKSSQPPKHSKFGLTDFEATYLPSTSKTSPKVPQNTTVSPEPVFTSPEKFLPIEKLKKIMSNVHKGKFKIKAKFQTVAQKLQQIDGTYHFVIVVEDSTGDLTVKVHSDLVTSLVGVSPKELAKMSVLALQQDKEVKAKIVKLLETLHQVCLDLDNVLEIQVTRGEKYPVVMNII